MLFNAVCYSIEYLKILLLFFFLLDFGYKSKKRLIFVSLASVAVVAGISYFYSVKEIFLSYALPIILTFPFMLKEKKRIFLVFIMYMYICIMDMSINGIMMYLFHITVEKIRSNDLLYLALNFPTLVLIAVVMLIKQKKHIHFPHGFSRSETLLMLVGGGALTFFITTIQLIAFSDMGRKYIRMTAIALSVCSMVFIVVLMKQINGIAVNQSLKKENQLMQRMLKAQEEYYQVLLEKENETKAFRHDMRNHLYCLNTLYSEGKYTEFENYLTKLTNTFGKLKPSYNTGNCLVDAILSQLSSKSKGVKIDLTGHFSDKMDVSSFDLCTIFFNVLQNAIEAAEKTEEKSVSVFIGYMTSNLLIKVRNSALSAPCFEEGRYISDKTGTGHGYGIQNVRECVEKSEGSFSMNYADGNVTTDIVLYGVMIV